MRALLVANADDADPGFIGQRFAEHGFVGERLKEHGGEFEHCERETPDSWPSLDGADLVVLLGSWWSAYWPDVAKSVRAECELILETHRRGIPLFGICFGAQIMATAFGGSAQRAQKHEVGEDVQNTRSRGKTTRGMLYMRGNNITVTGLSGPTVEPTDVTTSSRMASSGGLVTCANSWLK